jgi:hypothetical protein
MVTEAETKNATQRRHRPKRTPMRPTPNTLAIAPALAPALKGLITDADLPTAEEEWPGLLTFFRALPLDERPCTFLDLVWRFEAWRNTCLAA